MLQLKVLILYLAVIAGNTYAAKLLLLPFVAGSHLQWMANLARTLTSRGHQVTMLTTEGNLRLLEGVQAIVYNSSHPDYTSIFAKHAEDELAGISVWQRMQFWMDLQPVFLQEGRKLLFENEEAINKMSSIEFDMAVLDGNLLVSYHYLIPYKFDIPFVSISTIWDPMYTRVPYFPVTPTVMFEHTDQATTLQRFITFALQTTFPQPLPFDHFVEEFVPEKPYRALRDIIRDSRLFIWDTAPPLDYPRASLPHVLFLPSLAIQHPQPIQDADLLQFVDAAPHGVILVSLGSFVKSVPAHINAKFAKAFSQLKQAVVWKYDGPPLDVSANVKLLPWLPQNDLLAHPSVRLFVTHCGNNGQHEALYHGVPMLGTPVFGDQRYNALRAEHKGFGLTLDLRNFTVEEMVGKITALLSNPGYRERAELASAIVKDDPLLPVERAARWIEHVTKFGSDHLRAPSIEWPWYQYYMLDFFIILLLSTCTFGMVSLICVTFIVKKCLRIYCNVK